MQVSIDPWSGQEIARHAEHNPAAVEAALERAQAAFERWAQQAPAHRVQLLERLADVLDARRETLALLATREMGKRLDEARAEVEKCAHACRYYAACGEAMLADEVVDVTPARARIVWQPLGVVLAVMPWNFPYWQVFRCAIPALLAGNAVLLKHAGNVAGCALAIAEVFAQASAPLGLFDSLLIGSSRVAALIADPRIAAVSLTGSTPAGRAVAASAGAALKKCVLELGGSDAFIVCADADLDVAVQGAILGRFQNAGQSCIAAKRFIVEAPVYPAFAERFAQAAQALAFGDPTMPTTRLAPLARADLRDELHAQVADARAQGARVLAGGEPVAGTHAGYAATVLADVTPGMRAWSEELFGPVAVLHRVSNIDEALALANDTRFGLGGSVWTRDLARGEAIARKLACGCAFVNSIVKSDPRLPFGGIRESGYGRELSTLGLREFVNAKTLWTHTS